MEISTKLPREPGFPFMRISLVAAFGRPVAQKRLARVPQHEHDASYLVSPLILLWRRPRRHNHAQWGDAPQISTKLPREPGFPFMRISLVAAGWGRAGLRALELDRGNDIDHSFARIEMSSVAGW